MQETQSNQFLLLLLLLVANQRLVHFRSRKRAIFGGTGIGIGRLVFDRFEPSRCVPSRQRFAWSWPNRSRFYFAFRWNEIHLVSRLFSSILKGPHRVSNRCSIIFLVRFRKVQLTGCSFSMLGPVLRPWRIYTALMLSRHVASKLNEHFHAVIEQLCEIMRTFVVLVLNLTSEFFFT